MKTLTTLLFLFSSLFTLHAQVTLKHQVYFATDKHEINAVEQKKLTAFIAEIKHLDILKIELTGHTDSDASEEYNMKLSDRRVREVQTFISGSTLSSMDISARFFGETTPIDENTNPVGKQNNRRVEILITLIPPVKERPWVPDRVTPSPTETEITGDTIIAFPEGTLVCLPKKDYLTNPDCVSMVEYTDGESVRAHQLTTMSGGGDALISAGMFDVNLCEEGKCVKLLVPVPNVCGRNLPFTQWTASADGTWSENTGEALPIRMINGISYYEMSVCNSGRINCDVCVPRKRKCKLFQPKTKIKLKNGYKFMEIQIASDEPMIVEYPRKKRKRKAIFSRACVCTDPLVYVKAINKAGEIEVIDFTPLNEFDKREAFGPCKQDKTVKKILFFKIKKKTKYRKYLVRKGDFKKKLVP